MLQDLINSDFRFFEKLCMHMFSLINEANCGEECLKTPGLQIRVAV